MQNVLLGKTTTRTSISTGSGDLEWPWTA